MWQKRLRLVIAAFVIVFASVVALSFRRGRGPQAVGPVERPHNPDRVLETHGGSDYKRQQEGKEKLSIKSGSQETFKDGRTRFYDRVAVTLPDRTGRTIHISAGELNMLNPPDHELSNAEFKQDVVMTTSDGITASADAATYSESDGVVRIPGRVHFTKARISGTGLGATYDKGRQVLWLLDQAKIDVSPDDKGAGALHVTSGAAGMAKLEHYMKFTRTAHLEGNGRVMDADEATIILTEDEKHVQRVELRGNSHIRSSGGAGSAGGPQSMLGRDIDIAYAEDGRTLQTAHIVDNAVVQLPGQAPEAGRRVAGQTIDIVLAPDGTTVTNLTSSEKVQVDLPAAGDVPARRIRSSLLVASGPPTAGIQDATFSGGVEYHESRAANKGVAAIERSARAQRLEIKTKPGFGDLERADFHGNAHFTDGSDTTADAPLAVYNVTSDGLDLMPSEGDPGPSPQVTEGEMFVEARTIKLELAAQKLNADTQVRSVVAPHKPAAAAGGAPPPPAGRGAPPPSANARGRQGTRPSPPAQPADSVRLPAMLKQDQPVSVRSNRLKYDAAVQLATYNGNAVLWQDQTSIKADTIELDDKSGNLHAMVDVHSVMALTEAQDRGQSPDAKSKADGKPPADAKPKAGGNPAADAKPPALAPSKAQNDEGKPTIASADDMVYDDAKRIITYTTKAHMNGPAGDITADKIELYLTEQGSELDHAEAYNNVTTIQGARTATGNRLTYLAAKEQYTMTGQPVHALEKTPPDCKDSVGATLIFFRSVETISVTGNGLYPYKSKPLVPCGGSEPHP